MVYIFKHYTFLLVFIPIYKVNLSTSITIFGAKNMKKDIHPSYQEILFVDTSTGIKFVCGSTLQPKETEVYEGKEYPVYHVTVSSASHPFFPGSKQFLDTEGRVDTFLKRYARKPEEQQQKNEDKQENPAAEKKANKKKKKK